jgi:lipopolysaccharide/colanic/teichoic acid biosynthesis glycosyltransferase
MRTSPYPVVKRTLDVAAAGVLLVLTSPVQIVVAGLVAARLGRPVLFRQPRPGLHGEVFTLLKFRTMLSEDRERGLVTDEQRLTGLGKVLRSTSLDELPSLWNVLRGEMSIVGPRPLLVEYLPLYTKEQARRHDVRPGITGLAQVSGRNDLAWPDRFELDVQYVDGLCLALDARILAQTVRAVVTRRGISEAGRATMSRFEGADGG